MRSRVPIWIEMSDRQHTLEGAACGAAVHAKSVPPTAACCWLGGLDSNQHLRDQKPAVLPLDDRPTTGTPNMVGAAGFEPATPCPPDKCANQAAPRSATIVRAGYTAEGCRQGDATLSAPTREITWDARQLEGIDPRTCRLNPVEMRALGRSGHSQCPVA